MADTREYHLGGTMSYTIKEGCNHSHTTTKWMKAYSKFCVPMGWKRMFWRWTTTKQWFCSKCGTPMRHIDRRFYT